MSLLPPSLLYSKDAETIQRLQAYLAAVTSLRVVEDEDRLRVLLDQAGAILLFVDLRTRNALGVLAEIQKNLPEVTIIALGEPRSDPFLQAEDMGVYAAHSLHPNRRHFQHLVNRALDYVHMANELRAIKHRSLPPEAPASTLSNRSERFFSSLPLHYFSRAFRSFEDINALLSSIVEGVVRTTMVPRAGIFTRSEETRLYTLKTGIKCLRETANLQFADHDPFVRWMEIHAHVISLDNLDNIRNHNEKLMLRQTLDSFGAEVVVPIYTQGRLMGWLFLGHRVTGVPFCLADLEELTIVADHISTTIENAMLYEEVTVQKSLAETLFNSLPTGIIAIGADERIRWFNQTAGEILEKTPALVLEQPADLLGSRLASLLGRALRGHPTEGPEEWQDVQTKRALSAETQRLMAQGECIGAVALLQDMTRERALRDKQEQLERAAFWTELAASMSHEIRNPLVAIKTFAQLLPERYEDPEFRSEFSKLVSIEIERLNKIIDQINTFAHPPELKFTPIDLRRLVRKAIDIASSRTELHPVSIRTDFPEVTPRLLGDEAALAEGLAHLISNAAEACDQKADGTIHIRVRTSEQEPVIAARRLALQPAGNTLRGAEPTADLPARHRMAPGQDPREDPPGPAPDSAIRLIVEDNGGGIPQSLSDKVFSPFCTTKARGMGLGLPIVKRTIVDHNGEISIESTARGTRVTLLLPQQPQEASL